MSPIVLFVAVVLVLAWRGTTSDDRRRLLREAREHAARASDRWRGLVPSPDPFFEGLRTRTPRMLVTPGLVAVKAGLFLLMVMGPGAPGDPHTVLSWGASVGPQTSNGEWWRLLTAMFVSWGSVHLLAELAGLASAGILLERLVGPLAYAAVFFAAGAVAGAAGLVAHPVTVQAGASGAIAGLYGLLVSLLVWGSLRRSPATIPIASVRRLWPGIALFCLYAALAEGVGSAALRAGFLSGLGGGLVLATGLGLQTPRPRQVATVTGLSLAVVAVLAVPVRGMTDVAAEVAFVADVEARTSAAYAAEVGRFRRGRTEAAALRALIEEGVLPELERARARISGLTGVPASQQALVGNAATYLRLREASWRLRAEALGRGDFTAMSEADRLAADARLALREITEAVGLSN